MSCLLSWMSLCLFTPSSVYLTAGLETALTQPTNEALYKPCAHGELWCLKDRYSGPVGTLRLGALMPLTRELTLDYGLAHRSRLNTTEDRGQEFAFVELTWRPFGAKGGGR